MLSRLVAKIVVKIVVFASPSASSVSIFGILIFCYAVETYHLVELKWPDILSFDFGVMGGFSFVFDDKNARQGKALNDSRTKVETVTFKTSKLKKS